MRTASLVLVFAKTELASDKSNLSLDFALYLTGIYIFFPSVKFLLLSHELIISKATGLTQSTHHQPTRSMLTLKLEHQPTKLYKHQLIRTLDNNLLFTANSQLNVLLLVFWVL